MICVYISSASGRSSCKVMPSRSSPVQMGVSVISIRQPELLSASRASSERWRVKGLSPLTSSGSTKTTVAWARPVN